MTISSGFPRVRSAPELRLQDTPIMQRDTSPVASLNTFTSEAAHEVPHNETNTRALWKKLKKLPAAQQQDYFDSKDVPWNDSGVRCLRNANAITVRTGRSKQQSTFIHAHRFTTAQDDAVPKPVTYAAAQAPSHFKDACIPILIHALETGQGVYQFVSERANNKARPPLAYATSHASATSHISDTSATKHPSILDVLRQRMGDASDNTGIRLGDRFVITRLTPIKTSHTGSDHQQYLIEAEDVLNSPAPQKKYTAVITQVGLPFTNSVLTPNAIVRASQLLDAHQHQTETLSPTDTAPPDASQLIVSHAGIGRNATLIVYRDICSKIKTGQVNRANLDESLYRVIAAYRAIRGHHFVHSKQQLATLRAALWLHCAAPPKRSLAEWAHRRFHVGQPLPSHVANAGIAGGASAPFAELPQAAATLKRSRSLPAMSLIWGGRSTAVTNAVGIQPGGAEKLHDAQITAPPQKFHQEMNEAGKFTFHDVDKVNGHYSNFWMGREVAIDGENFKTVEHYFQAQKFLDAPHIRQQIMAAATPDETKKIAYSNSQFAMRMTTWENQRMTEMYKGVYAKFSQDNGLRAMLLATSDARLIEKMERGRKDTFWGVRNSVGANMLGQILMQVRNDLQANRAPNVAMRFDTNLQRQW